MCAYLAYIYNMAIGNQCLMDKIRVFFQKKKTETLKTFYNGKYRYDNFK